MKSTGPFTQYNRAIVRSKRTPHIDPNQPEIGASLLGLFGAGEAKLLVSFVQWAEADGTTYQ